MPGYASGFCVYNDLAVAIRWLLEHGVERVAYVDVDVHHGDGVQRAFWDDPRVLTISLHESGRTLCPGHRLARGERRARRPRLRGQRGAAGRAPATRAGCAPSTRWCPQLLASFRPQVLVTQQGLRQPRRWTRWPTWP